MAENKYCFEYEMKVRDYECDMQGIVNNANYQHYFEHARHEFLQWAGTSFTDLRNNGIEPVVNRIEIDYKFVFYQDIYRKSDDKICAKARVETVCINNGKLSRGEELIPFFKDYL